MTVAVERSRPRIDLTSGVWGPLAGLLVLIAFFSFKAEHFFTVQNAIIIFDQVTVYGILAIAMTLVIITGGIDLSVGSAPPRIISPPASTWSARLRYRSRRPCSRLPSTQTD